MLNKTCLFLVAALAVAGCDGIVTGESVQTIPLMADDNGGYAPVALTLTADMSPVALNFHARHSDNLSEIGKWNRYRATLSQQGMEIASGQFNVNHTGSPDSPMGAAFVVQTMLITPIPQAGDYELHITPTKKVEVGLSNVEISVRKNVRDVKKAD